MKYDIPDPVAELQNPGSQAYSKMVGYDFDNSGNRNIVETLRWNVSVPEMQNYQSDTKDLKTLQTKEVPGGKFAREAVEHKRIGEFGGIKGGQVSNKKWPLGKVREKEAIEKGFLLTSYREGR